VSRTDLQQHVALLERELQWARLKIQALREELRLERIQKYGPQSETLSDLQLKLLDGEPGVTGEEVEAEAQRKCVPDMQERQRKLHPGRQSLPQNLPRVEQVIACTDPTCKQCGGETTLIGYDESEQLDGAGAVLRACGEAREAKLPRMQRRSCGHARTRAAHY
jgi:hypothetical protein